MVILRIQGWLSKVRDSTCSAFCPCCMGVGNDGGIVTMLGTNKDGTHGSRTSSRAAGGGLLSWTSSFASCFWRRSPTPGWKGHLQHGGEMWPKAQLVNTSLVGTVSPFLNKVGDGTCLSVRCIPRRKKMQVWVFCQIVFFSDGSLHVLGLFLDY